ncbi:MAG: aminoacyl-tRNA hydrolase [Gemmatimonadetes bacterium]|uniref:Aminoacyl-tRNA hydrolase n=1 Tax=Candidatus Kutchimonas denitrificans TaxID=3056748 RepID=A0AAE5CDX6_9BACT|nr:aminoacyl-tRNA hydrolase [Gemmatimonadota bacterium]NIR76724.1 aminoacyl-tRNA hydrolase [Candidatus Kutchimonas denitrificans]NIS01211.1 aminoacyl-tRNA hydrolase [Gemmatimonadota bacterium]NIT68250.1 aminoacyl-tRNA hydrolase [Gemmatimonadota bacterium]NIW75468.1 aminoacyl-tRNA hydrolase [Gemmatimonadota bacterium]
MCAERTIPESEIFYQATRSGGPGGQHANRRATRVEACWNVRESDALTEAERERILERLASRIGKDGVLRVAAEDERSQHRNRELATQRLRDLVAAALHVPKKRKKTRPPKSVDRKRLEAKRRRQRIKKLRKPPDPEE